PGGANVRCALDLQQRLGKRHQFLRGRAAAWPARPVCPHVIGAADTRTHGRACRLRRPVSRPVRAGKIPYVDSVWDAIHTAIRPLMGAAVGALMAGHAHTLPQAAAAAIGGGTALATHLVKSGIRVGVNASPEPVSNVVASLAEDLSVAGLVVLALLHPLVAALIAAALLVLGIILVIMSAKRIRRAWRRRRERRRQRQAGQLSRAPL